MKYLALMSVLMLILAISGCTSNGGGHGSDNTDGLGFLDWCIPVKLQAPENNITLIEVVGNETYEGELRCNVQYITSNGTVNLYAFDMFYNDIWIVRGNSKVHVINIECLDSEDACSLWEEEEHNINVVFGCVSDTGGNCVLFG